MSPMEQKASDSSLDIGKTKNQEDEDERILNIILKAQRLSMSPTEQKASDSSLDIGRTKRDAAPAHYTLKIKSFSQLLEILSDTKKENYESNIFEASGYKWKLSLYPNGNKEKNGEGHISLYLVIAETESLPVGWEVKVNFKMFLFDQVHGTYSIFQDNNGKLHNFHKSETEHGFDKLLPLNDFKNPSNGFLILGKCSFGVEVFVWNNSGNGESIRSNQKIEATHTWKIDNFSSLKDDMYCSDDFTLGNRTWFLKIHPKGDSSMKDQYMSLFLTLKDTQTKGIAYASYKLRIRDQLHGKHKEKTGSKWFEQLGWGSTGILSLTDLHNPSLGFIVEDTLIIDVEIISISCEKKFILPS